MPPSGSVHADAMVVNTERSSVGFTPVDASGLVVSVALPLLRGLHPSTFRHHASTYCGLCWVYWVVTDTKTA